MRPTIFVDVDGVLADFLTDAVRVHGHDPADVFGAWPSGTYDVVDVLGIDQRSFWDPIHAAGPDFWANLRPIPGALDMLAILRGLAPVVLLTSPSRDPWCAAGKVRWMQRHLGAEFRDFLVGPAKWSVARPDAILVDDFVDNTTAFEAHGGHAVLHPQPWNQRHARAAENIAVTVDDVRGILDRLRA